MSDFEVMPVGTPDTLKDALEALEAISSGEAFRTQRFAEDDDAEYFLRAQRHVQQLARAALPQQTRKAA